MIGIVDYGVGNVLSVTNILKHIGAPVFSSSSLEELSRADQFILPGIGHFEHGWSLLDRGGFITLLRQQVEVLKKPILGICLGAQYLLEKSEEGNCQGFGWIKGRSIRFNTELMEPKLAIPHMGWNEVVTQRTHPLAAELPHPARFYFLHSYHFAEIPEAAQMLSCHYGYSFSCGIAQNNVMGVQFHPEKSHKFGMRLFRNFARMSS